MLQKYGFWKGLFTVYDHPILPRTNNDHELFFRTIKRRHRLIKGLRSWNRYIMHHGEYIVFAEDAISNPSTLKRLSTVSFDAYKNDLRKIQTNILNVLKKIGLINNCVN